MQHHTFYAYVEVREWGEPDREQRIGPFSFEAGIMSEYDAEAELSENLAREGDRVNRIEYVGIV